MKSLDGNRLYAWDHNTDYVSTFQNQTKKMGKRKKEKKGKKKRRSKEGEGRPPPVVPSYAQAMG